MDDIELPTSSVAAPLTVARVLVDAQIGDDRGPVLIEEQLEVVRRIVDVDRVGTDGLFATLA